MISLEMLVQFGGVLQFGLLIAGALMPVVLNWRWDLKKLDRFTQQIVWVHAAFIVIVLVGFGVLSVVLPGALTEGTPLARALCGFMAVFWLIRLAIQLFFFDAEPHLKGWVLRIGYRGLTGVFTYLTLVYAVAAWNVFDV